MTNRYEIQGQHRIGDRCHAIVGPCMIRFSLTDERVLGRQTAKGFAQDEIRPVAAKALQKPGAKYLLIACSGETYEDPLELTCLADATVAGIQVFWTADDASDCDSDRPTGGCLQGSPRRWTEPSPGCPVPQLTAGSPKREIGDLAIPYRVDAAIPCLPGRLRGHSSDHPEGIR